MTKSYAKTFGIIFGAITAVVGVATAVVGVATFRETARKDLDTKNFEAQKPFFEKQIEFYVDAMETVSKIATSTSPAKDDVDHFWTIYWGRLAAVEDAKVDSAMVLFGQKLMNKSSTAECLKKNSLLLAHCVKQSWADTWKVTLGAPAELPCDELSFAQVKDCT